MLMDKDALEGVIDLSEFNELRVEQIISDGKAEFCKYIGQCNKRCFVMYAEGGNCGVFRFYEKYGIDWQTRITIYANGNNRVT